MAKKIIKQVPLASFILIFIAWLVWIFYPQKLITEKKEQPLKEISGIAKVIDGDTVHLFLAGNKYKIRLRNIDAPESSQECYDAKNERYACGKVSTQFLAKIAAGKIVYCDDYGEDFYHRILGECFMDHANNRESLNQLMVKGGMAIIYDYRTSDENLERMEKQAAAAKLGIWQGAFQNPKDYRKTKKFKESFKHYHQEQKESPSKTISIE